MHLVGSLLGPLLVVGLVFNIDSDLLGSLLHSFDLLHGLVVNIDVESNVVDILIVLDQEIPLSGEVHDEVLTRCFFSQINTGDVGLVEGNWENVNLNHVLVHIPEALHELVLEDLVTHFLVRFGQVAGEERNVGVGFRVMEVKTSLGFTFSNEGSPDALEVVKGILGCLELHNSFDLGDSFGLSFFLIFCRNLPPLDDGRNLGDSLRVLSHSSNEVVSLGSDGFVHFFFVVNKVALEKVGQDD